jgi:hypothetical protein
MQRFHPVQQDGKHIKELITALLVPYTTTASDGREQVTLEEMATTSK